MDMRKPTRKEILEMMQELDCDIEKEHRKYSEFYVTASITVTQDMVTAFAGDGIDLSEMLGMTLTAQGMWSDDWGLELYEHDMQLHKEVTVLVPEEVKVIPAHTRTDYVPVKLEEFIE